jgi:hypothetical protein
MGISLDDAYGPAPPRGSGSKISYEDATGTQPEQPETWGEYLSGLMGAVSRGVLPFGAAEQLKGVVQGGLAKVRGEDYQPAHDKAVADAEAETKQIHARHPWLAGAAEGVGTAATGIATGGALGAARGLPVAGRALGAVGDFLSAAPGMQVASGAVGGAVGEGTDNPWLGLAAGLGVPTGVAMARKLTAPGFSRLPQASQDLLERVRQSDPELYDKISAGQKLGSGPLKMVESSFEQLPLTSASQDARNLAEQQAFTEASLRRSQTPGNSAAPDVLAARQADIGGEIGDIASRNALDTSAHVQVTGAPPPGPGQAPLTTDLITELGNIGRRAERINTDQVGRPILSYIEEIRSRIDPATGTVPGSYYRHLDSELGRAIKSTSNGDLRAALSDLRSTLREGMNASISPQDAAAWQQARRNYANIKTTEGAVNTAGAAAAGGQVPYTSLRGALNQSTGGRVPLGAGDQNDLARLGQILRPPPDSGTAGRSATISALTGKPLWATLGGGAGAGFLAGGLPGAAVGVVGSQALPWAAQKLYNTRAMQNYLVHGIPAAHGVLPQQSGFRQALAQRLIAEQDQQRRHR